MISKAKSDYYTHFISINSENPCQMCKHNSTSAEIKALPEHSSMDTLCTGSSFSKYFTDKIARIRSNFVINDNDYDFLEPPLSEKTLQSFKLATTNEVLIIIKKYPNKSCDLDPFPTFLLKSCID